jgi:hypothetical protein
MVKTYQIHFPQGTAFQSLLGDLAVSFTKSKRFLMTEFTVTATPETIAKIDADWLQEQTDQQAFSL